MTDTKGNIRARKLGNTGITEDILTRIANAKGGRVLAIVDLKVAFHGEDDDSNRKVALVIDQIEPVIDGKLNGAIVDHVRDIQAALHRNRMLAENGPQLPLDGQPTAPSTAEVLEQGKGVVGRDDEGPVILDDEDGDITGEEDDEDGDIAGEPWEYDQPEGDASLPTVEDPFLAKEPSTS